jgi:hypothetical protein
MYLSKIVTTLIIKCRGGFFWRKIVIFHTKYPKNFRASLRTSVDTLATAFWIITIEVEPS